MLLKGLSEIGKGVGSRGMEWHLLQLTESLCSFKCLDACLQMFTNKESMQYFFLLIINLFTFLLLLKLQIAYIK